MNFIDISSWQKGMDLKALCDKNPALDGVIVKATEGAGYFNPFCANWIKTVQELGKPFGFYHFLAGGDPVAEANYFWTHMHNYFGSGVPVADYEDKALSAGTGYLKRFLDRVVELSGVKPLVYCSLSVVQSQDFAAIAEAGYQLWIAQYADMEPVNGFLDHPWQKGSVKPFSRYVMQQYTSNGRLKGWDKGLDFDLFSGSYAEWLELAYGSNTIQPIKSPDPEVVNAVLHGQYGTGTDRIKKLTEDGYDSAAVQSKINDLYSIAGKVRPIIGNNLSYINSIVYIMKQL